jgi:CHAD domain-containing protein
MRATVEHELKLAGGAGAGPTAYLRWMLGRQYEALVLNDPIVRISCDADAVHDMRVAVRRLRSVLRTARPMLRRRWADSLRGELDWLGEALGAVRDLDVLAEHVQSEARALGADAARAEKLLRPIEAERQTAREALLSALGDPRYYRLLDAVEEAADTPRVRRDDVSVEKLARKEYRRLRKCSRRLSSTSDAGLHRLRIRAKRARYAAELAERSRGGPASRFIKAAKEVQDVLGEHQDAVVAEKRLRHLAQTAGTGAALAAGRLIERQELRKRGARDKAPKLLRRLRRRGKRAWHA